MSSIKGQIGRIASQYGLQIIYAFGSRAKEALDLVKIKDATQEKWTHLGDGGSNRVPLFSKNIPEGYWVFLKAEIFKAEFANPFDHFWIFAS